MSMTNATLTPVAAADARRFEWTAQAPLRKVVAALEAARPSSARFVGGCVRDSLLGEAPKDFDIATTLLPEEVIEALKSAGLGAAPTGIEHGTITGVADHVGVEITTLRADVSTDGRRATVAFSEDWSLDARRRDFTINAIYLTPDGKALFDPVGGVADARANRVKFIGAAEDRIREDYLRILRFFRFSARFSKAFDADGLAACVKLKAGIARLSAERVGDELSKILALPRASVAVEAMQKAGVLEAIWPAPAAVETLAALKKIDSAAPAPLGLAALWGEAGAGIDSALRLSNASAARRLSAIGGAAQIKPEMPEREARALLYRFGAGVWRDALLLARARRKVAGDWTTLAALTEKWTPPQFPISGKDVIALGIEKGPAVARILRAVEEAWITEDFPSRDRITDLLHEEVARAQA
jgi:poly(A) polymerase